MKLKITWKINIYAIGDNVTILNEFDRKYSNGKYTRRVFIKVFKVTS